jgi:hypothetical protein
MINLTIFCDLEALAFLEHSCLEGGDWGVHGVIIWKRIVGRLLVRLWIGFSLLSVYAEGFNDNSVEMF